ncbi:hypothetical protein RHD99_18155 [Buttiauxella selenatireducens]|uniref:Uncharacterized protein n=1 Tax=Buttiauxella selenatireducens TaxID=3073902 RepID=A0ABY9S7L8_9ENTR|nr:hypothetical protein [Buttiauxella sp. R73]WMY73359.1 hypothetical protein RHD99_18155 [Buttiauxella sp. R73]
MNINSKDLLAWDIVSIALDDVDPTEKKYLSEIVYNSHDMKNMEELPGAFDSGEVLQYTSQQLFFIIKYVLGIIAPVFLEKMVSISLDKLKEYFKDSHSNSKNVEYKINHSPDEVRKLVFAYCLKNKISRETAEVIANAIIVKLYLAESR